MKFNNFSRWITELSRRNWAIIFALSVLVSSSVMHGIEVGKSHGIGHGVLLVSVYLICWFLLALAVASLSDKVSEASVAREVLRQELARAQELAKKLSESVVVAAICEIEMNPRMRRHGSSGQIICECLERWLIDLYTSGNATSEQRIQLQKCLAELHGSGELGVHAQVRLLRMMYELEKANSVA